MSLSDAVSRFVPDGAAVVAGTALESCIPFAAGREIMRQRRRELTLIGPISDILFDQLIGAGCARRVRAAWVGNVITGSGYNFRRAAESGAIDIEDHSNLTLVMALRAAAMGVPYMPSRTALGSDLYRTNRAIKTVTCPFTGERLTAVEAIRPDVAVVHVQRADAQGNAHAWGNLGVTREACLAAEHVVVTTEEIVPHDVIASDPNRVLVPAFRVSAVVHAPWGAHPSPVPGWYHRDHRFFLEYQEASRTAEAFAQWRARWVDGAPGADDYRALLGAERTAALRLRARAPSAPADFGC